LIVLSHGWGLLPSRRNWFSLGGSPAARAAWRCRRCSARAAGRGWCSCGSRAGRGIGRMPDGREAHRSHSGVNVSTCARCNVRAVHYALQCADVLVNRFSFVDGHWSGPFGFDVGLSAARCGWGGRLVLGWKHPPSKRGRVLRRHRPSPSQVAACPTGGHHLGMDLPVEAAGG
jgi:hypothetical protein